MIAGKIVEFLDLKTGNWEELAPTNYKIGLWINGHVISKFKLLNFTDGHKLILVEGIPTILSWENIEQFNGSIQERIYIHLISIF